MTVEQFRARFTWMVTDTGCWIDLKGERIRISSGKPIVGLTRQEGAPQGKHGNAPGRDVRIPRLVYETFIGQTGSLIPHHACGNIACFNPEHLVLGHGKRQRAVKYRCQKCGETKSAEDMRETGGRHYVCKSHKRISSALSALWCDRCGRRCDSRGMSRSPLFLGMCKGCRLKALKQWLAENSRENARLKERRRKRARAQNVEAWKRRYKSDPAFKVLVCCRRRISNTLLRAYRSNGLMKESVRTRELIGCSIAHLMGHLEKQFKGGMSWENQGKWHIDHIRPLASFNLLDWEQCKQAYHWTNLQPLWAKKNMAKRARWDKQLTLAAY